MKFLNNLYQPINILSLDVVAGAVVGALFFGRIFAVDIQLSVLVGLALTVWIIYTLDHLRDAINIPTVASTDRHRFHQNHFRVIGALVIIVAVLNLVVVLSLPVNLLQSGALLGAIVLVYLVFQRYLKFLKEFFVACLYTCGILLPSLMDNHAQVLPVHYLIIGKYFVTAWMNLLLFSLFDYKEDRDHQQHSFVTWFGPRSTRYGIILLGLLNIVSGFWLWSYDAVIAVVFISMNLVLLGVLFFRRMLLSKNYYRIVGDAVFFIPALYLLWQ